MNDMICLISQSDCGLEVGNPVCPKCGMDGKFVYPGQVDLDAALTQAKAKYEEASNHKLDVKEWGIPTRPRLPGGLLDVDNQSLVTAEDLDWGSPPSDKGVLAAGVRRRERVKQQALAGDTVAKLI